jgi:hypothetical protein
MFEVAVQPYDKCNLTKIGNGSTIYSISAGTPAQAFALFGLFPALRRAGLRQMVRAHATMPPDAARMAAGDRGISPDCLG